jgi:hypothetical protein
MAIGTIVDHMNLWEETPREEQSATLRQQRDKLTSQAVALAGVFLVGSVASFGRVALLKIAGAVPPECRSDIHRRGYLQYQGHQCRKGYHVAWDTMSQRPRCRMGYHVAWDTTSLWDRSGERLVSRLRRQVFASLISRDVAYFDTRSTVRRHG